MAFANYVLSILKKEIIVIIFYIISLIFLNGCVEPYEVPEQNLSSRPLIVDASISDPNSSYVKLSRARSLEDTLNNLPVEDAQVTIEREDGKEWQLFSAGEGKYSPYFVEIEYNKRYRLKIILNEKEYISDYTEAKKTPPIEGLTWEVKEDGVQIYVDTNDPENKLKYFKWDYDETWQINTPYTSSLKWNTQTRQLEIRTDNINKCWRTEISDKISLFSTTNLSESVVNKYPLVFISSDNWRLQKQYSILVKQQALAKETYEFWQLLKKNSETLGSLFDPQPSVISGNIKCVDNPGELVIGFFNISSLTEKRIFIKSIELPRWSVNSPFNSCKVDTVSPGGLDRIFESGEQVPLNPVVEEMVLKGYSISSKFCVDCTLSGSNIKPSFWEE